MEHLVQVGIQDARLFQIMRQRILGQQMIFQLDHSAPPFPSPVWFVSIMLAETARALY